MIKNKIVDIDIYRNLDLTNYTYYKPLCYQLFSATDISKTMGKKDGYINLEEMIFKLFNYYELNKRVELGYSRFYMCSKILFCV